MAEKEECKVLIDQASNDVADAPRVEDEDDEDDDSWSFIVLLNLVLGGTARLNVLLPTATILAFAIFAPPHRRRQVHPAETHPDRGLRRPVRRVLRLLHAHRQLPLSLGPPPVRRRHAHGHPHVLLRRRHPPEEEGAEGAGAVQAAVVGPVPHHAGAGGVRDVRRLAPRRGPVLLPQRAPEGRQHRAARDRLRGEPPLRAVPVQEERHRLPFPAPHRSRVPAPLKT